MKSFSEKEEKNVLKVSIKSFFCKVEEVIPILSFPSTISIVILADKINIPLKRRDLMRSSQDLRQEHKDKSYVVSLLTHYWAE